MTCRILQLSSLQLLPSFVQEPSLSFEAMFPLLVLIVHLQEWPLLLQIRHHHRHLHSAFALYFVSLICQVFVRTLLDSSAHNIVA